MVEAELALARGNTRAARVLMEALGPQLLAAGLSLGELERRLLLARIDIAEHRPGVAARLAALDADARQAGAGLIASRAVALQPL